MIQKLNDNDIPPTHIMQLGGHRNVQSIPNYSGLNLNLQTNISGILSRTSQTQTRATADASTSKTPDEFFPGSCNKWRPVYDFRQRTYYLANYSNRGVHH